MVEEKCSKLTLIVVVAMTKESRGISGYSDGMNNIANKDDNNVGGNNHIEREVCRYCYYHYYI